MEHKKKKEWLRAWSLKWSATSRISGSKNRGKHETSMLALICDLFRNDLLSDLQNKGYLLSTETSLLRGVDNPAQLRLTGKPDFDRAKNWTPTLHIIDSVCSGCHNSWLRYEIHIGTCLDTSEAKMGFYISCHRLRPYSQNRTILDIDSERLHSRSIA